MPLTSLTTHYPPPIMIVCMQVDFLHLYVFVHQLKDSVHFALGEINSTGWLQMKASIKCTCTEKQMFYFINK